MIANSKLKNLHIFCFFALLFFVCSFFSLKSYASLDESSILFSSQNGVPSSGRYIVNSNNLILPNDVRSCIYLSYHSTYDGVKLYIPEIYVNTSGSYRFRQQSYLYVDGVLTSSVESDQYYTFDYSSADGTYFGNLPNLGNNTFVINNYSQHPCPIFYDFADVKSYLINGTLPEFDFDDSLKLDSFRVYSQGKFNTEAVHVEFNQIAFKALWSDERINSVEVSIYAVNPAFNYNPKNFTYGPSDSGVIGSLNIAGLTLHEQKFVVRATPYTLSSRGVSIQYELEFPSTFDQPIGQLVIPQDNTYPYSTTLDVSGDDVPIQWTVVQSPTYVYITNNTETYVTGDPVAYPVPVITEDTPDNYYTEYINNYYNTYNNVTKQYSFDLDLNINDISNNDITDTFDNVGGYFKGLGSFISRLAGLLQLIFPFLSPFVASTMVVAFGLIVILVVIAFLLKIVGAIKDLIPFV